VLQELAAAFGTSSAGLALLPRPTLLARTGVPETARLPWQENPELLASLRVARTAITLSRQEGGSWLVSGAGWPEDVAAVLWLEDGQKTHWDDSIAAALVLAGQVVLRGLSAAGDRPRWAQQLERRQQQMRLAQVAHVTRRLTHDFGNVLTGILGFTELALAQPLPESSPLRSYLTEVHRSTQLGSQLIQQLRLFGRRPTPGNASCALASVLADEESRLRVGDISVRLDFSAPGSLPPLLIGSDPLRQVLGILLDNAREAIAADSAAPSPAGAQAIAPSRVLASAITVSARLIDLSADDCLDFCGDVHPGRHAEITIADTGCGLSADGWQRLLVEPFFSTKPRHRGFGLAMAHGILATHRGGLQLTPGSQGGMTARVVVPVTASPAPPRSPVELSADRAGGRILVVDDDPMILHCVQATLAGAGFQVQTCASAETALQHYLAAQRSQPFQLVLADVLMPHTSGIDLARQLLQHDPGARVLLMSGQASAEVAQRGGGRRFNFLSKPFRPEGLLRTVRLALDAMTPSV
jgi:signal transduction histidine kinase/ActR/RegA family two-component response regulator